MNGKRRNWKLEIGYGKTLQKIGEDGYPLHARNKNHERGGNVL